MNQFPPSNLINWIALTKTEKKKMCSCLNWVSFYLSISSSRFVKNKRCLLCIRFQDDRKKVETYPKENTSRLSSSLKYLIICFSFLDLHNFRWKDIVLSNSWIPRNKNSDVRTKYLHYVNYHISPFSLTRTESFETWSELQNLIWSFLYT